MTTVNMHEAKTNLSKLVAAVRSGREREVLIAVNGTPAARLVPKLRACLRTGPIEAAARYAYPAVAARWKPAP